MTDQNDRADRPDRSAAPDTSELPVIPHGPGAGSAWEESERRATGPRRLRWTVGAMTLAGLLVAGGVGGVVTETLQRQSVAEGRSTISTVDQPASLVQSLDQAHDGIDLTGVDFTAGEGSGSEVTGQGPFSGRSGGPSGPSQSLDAGSRLDDADGVLLVETTSTTGEGAGTGMVLTDAGLALTNYHVVEGSSEVQVTLADTGQSYTATVLGRDATHDVAVLQIQEASGLETVSVETDATDVGGQVAAIGNGSGQGYLTAVGGTLTAADADISVSTGTASESLTDLLVTDADVVPGYSGGPLVDAEGQVIGMTSAASDGRDSAQVDGYAIPISTALDIADQIAAGTASGTVQIGASGALGVMVTAVPGGSTQTGGQVPGLDPQRYPEDGTSRQDGASPSGSPTGAQVVQVVEGSAADQAGIQAGDTVTSVAGTAVEGADALAELVQSHRPGDEFSIEWTDSSGIEHSAMVTLQPSTVN